MSARLKQRKQQGDSDSQYRYHDEDEQGVSKQAYLRRAAEVGVFPRHRRLAVPREEVVSVKRLGEIGLRGE